MGARVYDPYTGTFTQPDPKQGGGANAYGYTNGDPVNETDIDGQSVTDECTSAVGERATEACYDKLGSGGPSWGTIGMVVGALIPGVDEAEAAADVTEGIYEVAMDDGTTYVGQSGDIDARLAQHVASGKISQESADNAVRTEVLGGKTAREVAEQTRINEITEGNGASDPRVANIRNPIGAARQHLMPR
jgi:hypothetical protein